MTIKGTIICGLVGVAGNIGQREENVFKRLLEIDTIRGPHSTGILSVDARGNTEVVKAVGTPWNLYELKTFDEVMKVSSNILMGHNRWATKGKINRRNAHPFEHGHIIGAHNGTLRSQSLLIDHKDFEVDSDNIFHSMAKVGVDDTIKATCGAFALTWYDSAQETMNFVRNDERPLWLCESEDKRTVFWASERWMVEITLQLAGIKYREPFEPKPGQLFSYPIELAYVPKAFADVIVRPLELHKWPVIERQSNGYYGAGQRTYNNNVSTFEKAKEAEGNVSKKRTAADLISQGDLEFFVASLKASSATGQQYVSCLPTADDCDIELRLYTSDTKLIELMVNSVYLFKGRVRGFTTYGGDTYCTLDPRTIEELDKPVDEEDVELVVVYGSEIVTEDEYEVLVACGCGNCKTIPTAEESVDLVWLDKANFICGDCKDLPVVQDFIQKAVKQDVKQTVTKH